MEGKSLLFGKETRKVYHFSAGSKSPLLTSSFSPSLLFFLCWPTRLFSIPFSPCPSTYSCCYFHLTRPSTLTTSLRAQGLRVPLPSCKAPRVALLLLVSAGIQGGEKTERVQWALHPKAAHDPFLTSLSVQNPQEDKTVMVIKLLGFPEGCKPENRVHRQKRGSADQSAQRGREQDTDGREGTELQNEA